MDASFSAGRGGGGGESQCDLADLARLGGGRYRYSSGSRSDFGPMCLEDDNCRRGAARILFTCALPSPLLADSR